MEERKFWRPKFVIYLAGRQKNMWGAGIYSPVENVAQIQ